MRFQANFNLTSGKVINSAILEYPGFTEDMIVYSMESLMYGDQYIRMKNVYGNMVSINTDHIESVSYTFFVEE